VPRLRPPTRLTIVSSGIAIHQNGGGAAHVTKPAADTPLVPNQADISRHLYALFSPGFVQPYQDAWIEVAISDPATGHIYAAATFSVFELKEAAAFAEEKNEAGCNVYVGPALRQGDRPQTGRAKDQHVVTSAFAWSEFDGEGDDDRIQAILKERNLKPALVVTTGSVPCIRRHLYFKLNNAVTPDRLRAINAALKDLLDSDDVQNPSRIMRLAGTVSYPAEKKRRRGYIPELVTLHVRPEAHAYQAEHLIGLAGKTSGTASDGVSGGVKTGPRTDDDLIAMLEAGRLEGKWHNNLRDVVASLVGRGWSDSQIRLSCAQFCKGGAKDPELMEFIDSAHAKWDEEDGRDANRATPASDLPVIKIKGGKLSILATRAEALLISAKVPIYQRGGALVRPIIETVDASRGRKTKVATLKVLDTVYMRDILGRHATWVKRSESVKVEGGDKKVAAVNPPTEVAATILARAGDWTLPTISGVITTPTMRADGSLLTEQGYDEATRMLLVEPAPLPAMADTPTKGDAEAALRLLEDLLVGFPFVDDIAKAVALSGIITPVVRGAFPVAPLHASRAPTAGSGKSFLWDVVAAIAIGQPMPVMSTGPHTEEMEKRLGSALMKGQPLIAIDNISGELGGDALCQAIERPVVDIRVLGRSENVRVEARGTSLFATGNNFTIVGDVCRRVITCNLDPEVEQPELRQFDFDPVDRVLADRGKYIAGALTICRAYIIANRPNLAPRLASFEGWSDIVRSALIWLGKEDPVKSMESAKAEDPERLELISMQEAWGKAIGIGGGSRVKLAAVLLKGAAMSRQCDGAELEPTNPELHAALEMVHFRGAGKRGQPDARMLGLWLRRFKGRVIEGKRFSNAPNEKGGSEWWLERVNKS
jgi:hypothetical protein